MIREFTGEFIREWNGIFLYKRENDYCVEVWGSSTKAPDLKCWFSEWGNKDELKIYTVEEQLPQWLMYIASTMIHPFIAIKMLPMIQDIYDMYVA